MYRGMKVKCKYAETGIGTILRKQGKNGYMVEFQWYRTFQDFGTLELSRVLCTDKMYMKTEDMEIVNQE